jgi:hypothetical protein
VADVPHTVLVQMSKLTDHQQYASIPAFSLSRKTRLQHSLMNHYLPLYFPEAERSLCTTRAGWFARLLIAFPTPAAITRLPEAEFVSTAGELLRTKHSRETVLHSFHAKASESIGIPVPLSRKRLPPSGCCSAHPVTAICTSAAMFILFYAKKSYEMRKE